MKLTFKITYLTLAGKTQVDTVEITLADFAAWDSEARTYIVYQGNYTLRVALNGIDDAAASPHTFSVPVNGTPWCRPAFPGAPPCQPSGLKVRDL